MNYLSLARNVSLFPEQIKRQRVVTLKSCGVTFKVLLFLREHDHGKTVAPGNQGGFEPA